MLTIRNEQLRAFGLAARHAFEERMAHHLGKFFPDVTVAIDSEELAALIRYGCDRAASRGFKSERDVCKYIELMLVFGSDFDKDPGHSWAIEILDRADLDGTAKMKQLVSAAVKRASTAP